jgi:hypothetical protein
MRWSHQVNLCVTIADSESNSHLTKTGLFYFIRKESEGVRIIE